MTEPLLEYRDAVIQQVDDAIHANRADQIAFLQDLIRANSANPFTPDTSDPTEPIEYQVARRIHAQLTAIGLVPEYKGVSDARPNVIATLPGSGNGKSLILNGHMDTVTPNVYWTRDPFAAEIEDGRLYGLGALDMKASLSMFVYATKALLDAGITLGGDLILTFVVDEEPGGYSRFGSAYLLDNGLHATAAIVAEPKNHNVTVGHRGGYRFRLTVYGVAVHTGMSAWERGEGGCNAITDMMAAIQALADLPLPFEVTPAFPDRRPVITFPTLIQGGTSINAVPDECIAYGDIRLLPGCDADCVERLIHERLAAIPSLAYQLDRLLFVPAVELSPDEPIVQTLVRHTRQVLGFTPTTLGCGPWNDGWMFMTRGIPTVCGFGPNGSGAHGADEYVELDSLIETTQIVARAIMDFLR